MSNINLEQFDVPNVVDARSVVGQAAGMTLPARTPSAVRLGGVLIAKTKDAVLIASGGVLYELPVAALLSIDADPSQPSADQLGGGIAVIASIERHAEILEMRTTRADSIGDNVGIRPLPFALPSAAPRYAVSAERSEALSGTHPTRMTRTFQTMNSRSPYPSTYQSQWPTPHVDHETDYQVDFETDTEAWYQTDYDAQY